jgi:hypothetical protein
MYENNILKASYPTAASHLAPSRLLLRGPSQLHTVVTLVTATAVAVAAARTTPSFSTCTPYTPSGAPINISTAAFLQNATLD